MSVDPKIQEAIEAAVAEAGQPTGLARKLIRWFEAVASGNEDIHDRQAAYRHLELLYEEVEPANGPTDDQLAELVASLTIDEEDV